MSKIAFTLYYGGFIGLIAAYATKEVWLDRISLIFLLLGCWMQARLWKHHIESITTTVPSLVAALDLLNNKRKNMDIFVRLMPNLFGETFAVRSTAEKLEFKFIRQSDKTTASALRTFWGNFWEIIPVVLCGAIPLWWFGIGEFHYERYYLRSPLLHDCITLLMVTVLPFVLSTRLTTFLISHLLRK
jgi:hypothetical protein